MGDPNYKRQTAKERKAGERGLRLLMPKNGATLQRIDLHGAALERLAKHVGDSAEGRAIVEREIDRLARIDQKKPRHVRRHERDTAARQRADEAKRRREDESGPFVGRTSGRGVLTEDATEVLEEFYDEHIVAGEP